MKIASVIVEHGETLSHIAATVLKDRDRVHELAKFNQIDNPHLVRAGTVLVMPVETSPSVRARVLSPVSVQVVEHLHAVRQWASELARNGTALEAQCQALIDAIAPAE